VLDLHTHSSASDGLLSPEQLVRRAKAIGLSGIALTDHDTISGLAEALAAANECGLKLMPGVEISTEWRDNDVHILGYFVENKGPLPSLMEQARSARLRRIQDMVAKLMEIGIDLSFDEVVAIAGDEFEALGRPHIARVLVQKKVVADVPEAFSKYLERGRPAFVPRYKLSPEQAIKAIIGSGGVAVWAHPGELADKLILDLTQAGLAGIEVYHPLHSDSVMAHLRDLARARSLVITGGSDAHEARALGSRTVPDEVWTQIMNRKL